MSVTLSPPMFLQFFNPNNSGAPAAGYLLFTYIAGTSTKQATWTDSTQTVQNSNPIILDSNGAAYVWLDPTLSYKYVFAPPNDTDPPTSPIRSEDNILGGLTGNTLYPRTPAEIAAGVTPTSYIYPPGNVLRYGAVGNGVFDDTNAISAALRVVNFGSNSPVIIPQGYSFNVTSYIEIFSNTAIYWYGNVQLNNHAAGAGFFAVGRGNIGIYGFKIGQVIDVYVNSHYDWNHQSGATTLIAPSIHIRSCTDVQIDGMKATFVCEGIQLSSATANTAVGASWVNSGAPCVNCIVSNCVTENCELGGITGYVMQDSAYLNNFVGRCGDGGMWMMGTSRCRVVGNHRVGPQGTVAAVNFGAGPFNVLANPNTWNDEQGLQFEACVDLLIEGNIVENMWAQGIDIKNNSERVLCQGNSVIACENGSIVVREGDATKNACHKITIRNNIIANHGTLWFNIANGIQGAIRVGECYIAEVTDNTVYSYQNTPGISLLGPGAYQAAQYAGNPHQAAVTCTGNSFDFKSTSQQQDPNEIQFMGNAATWTANTAYAVGIRVKPTSPAGYFFICEQAGTSGGSEPSWTTSVNTTVVDNTVVWVCESTFAAILVSAECDSIKISDNHIRTDRYLIAETRNNLFAAIFITYVLNGTTSAYYPTALNVTKNVIDGWGSYGISVVGLTAMAYSGLTCVGNSVNACAASGIVLAATHKAVCNANSISQCGSGAGFAGIQLNGTVGNVLDGVVCSGNAIVGGLPAGGVGGNGMTSGIDTNYAANIHAQNNTIAGFSTANQRTFNISGDHDFSGTTGFWRTNAGSPNGAVVGLWRGELLFDTTNLKWWACSQFGTTTWTQLTN
jgi:Right handed beta helix region